MKHHSRHLGADVAGAEDAVEMAPNPAVAEMLRHACDCGIETVVDRLEMQQPQCGYGLRGLCCRMCQMGPCRINDKSPRGVCGRSMELIVVANLARAAAAGTSAQTMHAHELILTLQAVARREISLSVTSTSRLQDVGHVLNLSRSWWSTEEVAQAVADVMLEDLSRMTEGEMQTLRFAPKEFREEWKAAGLSPRSAAFEVFETMHMTTLGACSDWEAMFAQALRTSIAYAYSGLVVSSVLTDVLFGIPERRTTEVNFGVLDAGHVNMVLHGHSPVMLEKILEKVEMQEFEDLAKEAGAEGIIVAGMCCTGHEALARHGVPTLTGAMGQELVLATGAADLIAVDMQCVLPGMREVAEHFGTRIVTTYRSNRIPGADHIPFDPEHPESLDEDAMRIVRMAIEAFAERDRTRINVPDHTTTAVTGFSREEVVNGFGGVKKLLTHLQEGRIRGIAAMVGCSTPKAPAEASHVAIARELIGQGVLVLASGCAAHALIDAGLCTTDALADAPEGLREACGEADMPPVLVVGSCSDNARIIQLLAALAHEAREPLSEMPFALSGSELVNEKTVGQLLAVLAHGVSAVVGLTPGLPIPAIGPTPAQAEAGSGSDDNSMVRFFSGGGLEALVGSNLLVEPDPARAAAAIVALLDEKAGRTAAS